MSCADFELLMAEALGDEIGAADRARLDAHLRDCAACREAFAEAGEAVGLLRRLPGAEDDLLAARTAAGQERWTSKGPGASGGRRWLLPMLRYAAVVAAAFAAGYAWSDRHPQQAATSLEVPDLSEAELQEDPAQHATSFESALARAYRRKPGGSDLAKCMSALFRSG